MENKNALEVISNKEIFDGEIRTLTIEGKPFFVGSDVAKALGYKKPNNAINSYCRSTLKWGIGVETGNKADGTPAIQKVEMNIIPEGDIYRLIMKSKLPKAQEFESWVCDEVLPTIRETGGYIDNVDKLLETTFNEVNFTKGQSIKEMLKLAKDCQNEMVNAKIAFINKLKSEIEYKDSLVEAKQEEIEATREQLEESETKVTRLGAISVRLEDRNDFLERYSNKLEDKYDKISEEHDILLENCDELLEKTHLQNIRIKDLKNGENALLTVGDVVKLLKVPHLNTTCFHEWLCSKDLGEMIKNTSGKSRYFSPNEKFIERIAKKGYAWTNLRNGKIEIRYRENFINRIKNTELDRLTIFAKEYRYQSFK